MSSSLSEAWFSVEKPVIGMLHVPPLPGSPDYGGELESIRSAVMRDAEALAEGGIHGLLIENFGDRPFYPHRVPSSTATHLTALAVEVRRCHALPLGINVLRNDARTALAVAQAAEAQFIRVNVLTGARVTDQGLIQGVAHDLLRDRTLLGAEHIKILADVGVKHSAPLSEVSLEDEVRDLVDRGGADGIIVTGRSTGEAPSTEELQTVEAATGRVPIFVGSGVTAESVDYFRFIADGFIVGSYFKVDGLARNPVDPVRVRALMERLG